MSSSLSESPDYVYLSFQNHPFGKQTCAKTLRQTKFSVTWWKYCPPHSDILSDEIADHIVANSGGNQYGWQVDQASMVWSFCGGNITSQVQLQIQHLREPKLMYVSLNPNPKDSGTKIPGGQVLLRYQRGCRSAHRHFLTIGCQSSIVSNIFQSRPMVDLLYFEESKWWGQQPMSSKAHDYVGDKFATNWLTTRRCIS